MDWFSPFTNAWSAIQSAAGDINGFFTGFDLTGITDTGKGIAAGLMALGSYILSAVSGSVSFLAELLSDGLAFVANVSAEFGRVLFSAASYVGYALHQGLAWLGNSLYAAGQWVFNSASEMMVGINSLVVAFFNWVASHVTQYHAMAVASLAATATQINSHMTSFAGGIVDKMGAILTNHLIMGVVQYDVDHGQLSFKGTGIRVATALVAGPVIAAILEGLIP